MSSKQGVELKIHKFVQIFCIQQALIGSMVVVVSILYNRNLGQAKAKDMAMITITPTDP